MTTATDAITFEAPGPGSWALDSTHHGHRPLTRFAWPIQQHSFERGLSTMMARYGLPLAGGILANVHGLTYFRILAVGEKPTSSGGAPPAVILKLLARLHPELRRRNRTAAAALAERSWRRDVDSWFDERRDRAIAANLALQHVDLATLDDAELVAHVEAAVAHATASAIDGFVHHGGDIIPAGLFLAACEGWGIPIEEAAALLQGSSPALLENDRLLAPVAAAIAQAPMTPASMAEVRALGPEVASIVDEWLELHGWRLMTSDDIDAPTLTEQPAVQLRAVLAARADRHPTPAPDPGAHRARVPAGERARFDDLLAEARHGMSQRDDTAGIAWNWPFGLIRRAMLEVGRRLVERSAADLADHAVELEHAEVAPALAGTGPGAEELAARRAFRDRVEAADPPATLGPEEAPPPLDAFPTPLATMARAALTMISAMEGETGRKSLTGVGVGTGVYRGRACVVRSPVDAHDRLEQGDVLVVPFTSPSYDSLFPLVGAMVTDLGGPLSHTAIMAREFGVPAVIGVAGATAAIAHGAVVEVDATAGAVRLVD